MSARQRIDALKREGDELRIRADTIRGDLDELLAKDDKDGLSTGERERLDNLSKGAARVQVEMDANREAWQTAMQDGLDAGVYEIERGTAPPIDRDPIRDPGDVDRPRWNGNPWRNLPAEYRTIDFSLGTTELRSRA